MAVVWWRRWLAEWALWAETALQVAIPRLGPLWGSGPHTISNLELAHPLHVGALVSTTYLTRGHPFLEFISNSVGPQKSKHSSWVHRIRWGWRVTVMLPNSPSNSLLYTLYTKVTFSGYLIFITNACYWIKIKLPIKISDHVSIFDSERQKTLITPALTEAFPSNLIIVIIYTQQLPIISQM